MTAEAVAEAKKIFDEELAEAEQTVLSRWRNMFEPSVTIKFSEIINNLRYLRRLKSLGFSVIIKADDAMRVKTWLTEHNFPDVPVVEETPSISMLEFVSAIKGGPGSGNRGHAGIPGHRGGSKPKDFLSPENAGRVFAGKTGEQWMKEQRELSDEDRAKALADFDRAKVRTEVKREDYEKYLSRLGDHRALILDESMKVAQKRMGSLTDSEQKQLMSNLMQHDRDKYDFGVAEAYVGTFRVSRNTYEGAFTAAMTNHHLANPHHWEHWVRSETIGGKTTQRALPIPRVHFIEMMGDWNGTARERGTPQAAYYKKFGKNFILHPETRAAAERELGLGKKRRKKENGLSTLARVLKGSSRSGNYGHAGRPGKRGGSSPQAVSLSQAVNVLQSAVVGGRTFTAVGTGTSVVASGAYSVYGTYGNKKGSINAANKAGQGFVPVRVNGTYMVLDARGGPGKSVQQVDPKASKKAGLPAGDYVSVYSVPTNKKAAVNKATKLGPGYTAVRVNGAYHVLKTGPGAAAATSSAAKATNKPATVKNLFDNATKSQQDLAKKTGILPTDAAAEDYVRNVIVRDHTGNIGVRAPGRSGRWHQHNTIALSTISAGEAAEVTKKFTSSWDKNNHRSFTGTVKNVFKITHPAKVQKAFDERVAKNNNVKKGLYHGTDLTAAVLISSGGFKVPAVRKAGRMLGDGVYLADMSSKSVQYLSSGSFSRTSRARGVLFQTTAAMGNMKNTSKDNPTSIWGSSFSKGPLLSGVDSVYAPKGKQSMAHQRLINSEYLVGDPKAVLPDIWLDIQRN